MEIKLNITYKTLINSIYDTLTAPEAIEFVKQLEERFGTMDFTEPLYKYFKNVVKTESPEDL